MNSWDRKANTGWPPHTWRIPEKSIVVASQHRMTSTYVENTKFTWKQFCKLWDDLHIRGEYWCPPTNTPVRLGWPPHTWRIPTPELSSTVKLGMTSTYVENTLSYLSRLMEREDDLHIRGEYSHHNIWYFFIVGWPPHTWRIQDGKVIYTDSDGMTSTYVENTIELPIIRKS